MGDSRRQRRRVERVRLEDGAALIQREVGGSMLKAVIVGPLPAVLMLAFVAPWWIPLSALVAWAPVMVLLYRTADGARWLRLDRNGIHWPYGCRRPKRLVLSGVPGSPLVLRADDELLAVIEVDDGLDEATRLAQGCADALGIELEDVRHPEMRRWLTDARFRGEATLDRLEQDARRRFARLYELPPTRPESASEIDRVVLDVDRTRVVVDHRGLTVGNRTTPLEPGVEVFAVPVEFGNTVMLALLTDEGLRRVAEVPIRWASQFAQLRWLAIEATLRTRPQGSESEIPASLRAYMQAGATLG